MGANSDGVHSGRRQNPNPTVGDQHDSVYRYHVGLNDYFYITAPVVQSGIEVNVPRTEIVQELAQERLVVSIDREQRIYLQSDPININALGPEIQARLLDPASRSIYLRADTSVPFGTIAVVMDRLNQAGIENISVVTQPLDAPEP